MALKFTKPVITLQKILNKQSAQTLLKILKNENDNVTALVVALCDQSMRTNILEELTPSRRLKIIKSLSTLKQPPDFVIQVVLESLQKKL